MRLWTRFRKLRDQGKVTFWGMTAVGETAARRRVIDSAKLNTVQSVYNLVNPSAGADVSTEFDMPNYGNLFGRASASRMGVLVIRVLAAGALTGEATRHPVAVPSVAPIGSGQEYVQDLARANEFRWLQREGYLESLVEASHTVRPGQHWCKQRAWWAIRASSTWSRLSSMREEGLLPAEAMERLPRVWAGFTG